MKEFFGFVLVIASVIGYFFTSTQLGWYQSLPIVPILIAVGGCTLVGLGLSQRKSIKARILSGLVLLLAVGLTGLYTWYTVSFSQYDGDQAPAVNQDLSASLNGMALASHTGADATVQRAEDRGTLVVFYRGFW